MPSDLSADPAPGWVRFEHPEGLFCIDHPARWRQVSPVSRGAALSCRAGDGSVLFEVMCFSKAAAPDPGERGLVEVVVEGLVKYGASEDGMYGGRVIARNAFAFGGAEDCVDVLLAYRDAAGVEISTDYLTVGSGREALYVAMKTPTAEFPANLPDFERALGTLRTPWMRAEGPPDLSSGGRARATRVQLPSQTRAEIAAILDAPPAPAPTRRGRIPWLIIGVAVAALVWFVFLRR